MRGRPDGHFEPALCRRARRWNFFPLTYAIPEERFVLDKNAAADLARPARQRVAAAGTAHGTAAWATVEAATLTVGEAAVPSGRAVLPAGAVSRPTEYNAGNTMQLLAAVSIAIVTGQVWGVIGGGIAVINPGGAG
jgi:hypothetical protein